MHECFGIKKVIFNVPATIILWEDGTKTVPSWCPLTPVNMQQMDAIIKAIQDPVYTRR